MTLPAASYDCEHLRARASSWGHSRSGRCQLSVVVPCFNEEEVIPEFARRMRRACESASVDSFEILLVDDGSRDRSWSVICAAAKSDPAVMGVRLSRNFGHQYALSAGLSVSRGETILIIDADLQDPPELLPAMCALLNEGADVVYGQRTNRKGETFFKTATASLFYRMLRRLAAVDIPVDAGDFRLVRRPVLDALLSMPEQHRFIRGMVAWLGFRQVPLAYERQARFAGETKYPLGKMFRFAVDAVTSFSIVPLRMSIWCGFLFAILSLSMLAYSLAELAMGKTVPGWTSLIVVVAGLGGVQLLCMGTLAEYVGRTYLEAKRRPLYVIAEFSNEDAPCPGSAPDLS